MNGGVTPFVLPGPPLARNTLAGWDAYRRTRKSFTPAPVLDRDACKGSVGAAVRSMTCTGPRPTRTFRFCRHR